MLTLLLAFALVSADDLFPLENDVATAQVLDDSMSAVGALSRAGTCHVPNPASDGCRFVRDESYKFSEPVTTTKDFERLVAESGGMEKFRKRFGLFEASDEQKRGRNAGLPMGLTYSADKSHVHINCFLCHGGSVGGRSVEGGANARLRFENMVNAFKGKSLEGNLFVKMMGDTGFSDYEGATAAADMSLVVSGMRDASTGNVDFRRVAGMLSQSARGKQRKQIPVYAPPWWNNAPGLRRATFYSSGPTNQSAGHLMQFAMGSTLKGSDLRELVPAFNKILACVKSKPPPRSPLKVDQALANRGRGIYQGAASADRTCNCASCHGGGAGTFPEKHSPLSQIGTDGALAGLYSYDDIGHHEKVLQTFDPESTVPHKGERDLGYVAPPLVALFTKPAFLHNHSVPTARELLCKSAADRAPVWSRRGEGSVFDDASVSRYAAGAGESRYDTRRPGFSNRGHDYCKMLKEDPKACDAMVEYLKTL